LRFELLAQLGGAALHVEVGDGRAVHQRHDEVTA
jgi:hypothetical protein